MTTDAHHEQMDHPHITAYLRHLELAGRAATTLQTYATTLRRAARQMPAGLLATPDELAEWIAAVPARNSRAGRAVCLRGFYRWCVRTDRISVNPMLEVATKGHRRGEPRPVSHAELATLLERAAEPARTWCLLAAYAGLRCCEIATLRREDVDEQVIRLHGKGDRQRAVPTHPRLWQALAGLPPGPVAGVTAKHVSRMVSRAGRDAGLPGVTAHRLRHWAGTWWQAATGDIRVTQELLGHASPATTAIYTAVSDRARRAAVLALPEVTAASGDAAGPPAPRPAPPAGAAEPGSGAPGSPPPPGRGVRQPAAAPAPARTGCRRRRASRGGRTARPGPRSLPAPGRRARRGRRA